MSCLPVLRTDMKVRFLVVSLILILEQWNCIGLFSSVPTTTGFVPSWTATPTSGMTGRQGSAGLSKISVMSRVDDLNLQLLDDPEHNPSIENSLWSYVYNLQRARKSKDLKPAKSLAYFLKNHHALEAEGTGENPKDLDTLVEVLERALTQALRLAGEVGDYRLVLQLLESSIQFAKNYPVLKPRIFGEALDSLSNTHANASKMKQVWNLVAGEGTSSTSFLSSPLSAFELNVLIKSLASRGKTRACVDLYRRHTIPAAKNETRNVFIRPDAYTASTIFSVLTDSIHSEQTLIQPEIHDRRSVSNASKLEVALVELCRSPCWQWSTAVEFLPSLRDGSQWNNHAYSALLKLQDKAQDMIPGHENGPQIAMAILESMLQQNIRPDVVTCTLAIKAMGDPTSDSKSWKLAVRLLDQLKMDPQLPNPNEYSYSAAIVACARCGEFNVAMDLLQELRTKKISGGNTAALTFVPPHPNTWIYNAALSAIGQPDGKKLKRTGLVGVTDRREMAKEILEQMKEDHEHLGIDTLPDTVTYNTVIAMSGGSSPSEVDSLSLINQMKAEKIPRDRISYRNAIISSSESSTILSLLKLATEDIERPFQKTKKGTPGGGYTRDMVYVFNAALSTLASQSNLKIFKEALTLMQDMGISPDSETLVHLINVLGRTAKSEVILSLLTISHDMDERTGRKEALSLATGLKWDRTNHLEVSSLHFSTGIEICLQMSELENARAILAAMRDRGITPSLDCLEHFALGYAQSAIRSASKESRRDQTNDSPSISQSRAKNAYQIAMALRDPAPAVLAKVAQANAATAQWKNAQGILRSVHRSLLSAPSIRRKDVEMLRGVHSSLIRECARQGNVTVALWYANDIQNFAGLARDKMGNETAKADTTTKGGFLSSLRDLQASSSRAYAGMRADDWVSLAKAASKSGHWRVCLNTIQFLRPHVQRTNPDKEGDEDTSLLDARYEKLAPALTAVSKCLEMRSQYAWAVRLMDEWMEWSGRKPPTEAVLSTIRILSNRGQGEAVKSLLARCIQDGPAVNYNTKGIGYEERLYLGAITALHNNGLYDDADEVFISAITEEHLPFVFGRKGEENVYAVDLHGMNVALAHSAVRVAMRRLAAENKGTETFDMVVITGRGRNSALRMRPVLRPEVQRMLLEEFYPPLNTVSLPGNTGALLVYHTDMSAWQAHQQEQKGARMQALAVLLKTASTDRLHSIALKLGGTNRN